MPEKHRCSYCHRTVTDGRPVWGASVVRWICALCDEFTEDERREGAGNVLDFPLSKESTCS